jgi:hydroxyacylglutathione hydrolase
MLLKYFYDKKLAQASYMVGCAATGEALIVDPARDIQQYLDAAEKEGLRITHITETHIHADFVSGSRELAAHTNACLFLSDEGDENWKYGYADDRTVLVKDNDWWMVGNVKVEVIHTPGHTPEHISFLITDTAGADRPIGLFTGDFLFVGDVGRPDLLEEAAGLVGTKEVGARQQFKSVERIKQLPDYLQVWPGHGAGSACGKALGALPSTTLGYEKLFNPAFQHDDEDSFVEWLLEGQPEAPRYFKQMKHVNKVGPELLANTDQPSYRTRADLDRVLAEGALVLDMRSREDFATSHVSGTVSIPENEGGCVNYIGWFVEYEKPMYILAYADKIDSILREIKAIGVDHVGGVFTPDVVDGSTESLSILSADEVAERIPQNGLVIVDVRGETEYRSQHIAGAMNIPFGYLPQRLDELPKDRTIVVHCASGTRSQVAASVLLRHGFTNVVNLGDGMDIWSRTLTTETS